MSSLAVDPAPAVSVIIPCHNAIGKIGRCLNALRRIEPDTGNYEVIFVDDCSTDGTHDLLLTESAAMPHWHVLRLAANSGSPSEPRNRGIAVARGEFVFFLDCDDEILPDTLRLHLAHARATGADIVRGDLIVEDRGGRRGMNQIRGWSEAMSRQDRIRQIIRQQSTTVCSLIRTDVLRRNAISWRADLRMGEDTLFLIRVLAASQEIAYLPHPTFVYVKTPNFTPSSTQSYGDRELRDHLTVWREAIVALGSQGVDYVGLRLQVGLQSALRAMVFSNRGDIHDETLRDLGRFLSDHAVTIAGFALQPRFKELLALATGGDIVGFRAACRPRLLIAGHDLKFITGLTAQLAAHYDLRFDVWTGHDSHDEAASREALAWAELIWCEWMLGNAVWYARHKRADQRLIVRMHRFELGRDFGEKLDIAKVDAVVAVSTLFLERLLERFPLIPRQKARLQHNYVDTRAYVRGTDPDRRFRLGMIGILPARKGLLRGLEILKELRADDPRYTLDIFGHSIDDLAWLRKIPVEVQYFKECEALSHELGLTEAVRFRGHVNVREAIAEHGIGIVLSLSDQDRQLPESFHLAVADGFAAGGVGLVRYWEGAEYVWPARYILPDEAGLIARILHYRDHPEDFLRDSAEGGSFVESHYGTDQFVTSFKSLFQQTI